MEKGIGTAASGSASPHTGMLPSRCRSTINTEQSRVADSSYSRQTMLTEVQMRLGSVIFVIWLIIGGAAARQRGDYKGPIGSCRQASTIPVTILSPPLNYPG